MANITLEIETRGETGKKVSSRLRADGLLPVVVYGKGKEAVPGVVNKKEFVQAAQRARTSSIFVLKSKDKNLDGKRAFVKEIQRDFVKKEVLHVDLLAIHEGETVRVFVPVEVTGEASGVKNQGGVMTMGAHEIEVEARPDDLPEVIVVDVTAMNLGDRLHASDLVLPQGVTLRSEPEMGVVSVLAPKAAKVEEGAEAAAAEAGAAPEAAAAAEEGAKGGE